jgi:hypothetical protein
MVFQVMELIRRNLNTFLSSGTSAAPERVILGNIAYATPDNTTTPLVDESAQVYMSLVNVEEEQTLKNLQSLRQTEVRPLAYVNPPMFVNLYVLFTANHKDYNVAIENLSQILFFFQGNRAFSLATTPVASTGVFATIEEIENRIKVNVDLMSLTFEQVNHLWGSLGGKQMPFLLYKVRQVEIDANRMLRGGGVIEEIQIN